MTDGDAFTVKEIVLDIRDTVKDLAEKVDRIDQHGSIGTRDILTRHSRKIEDLDHRLDVIEATPRVTREDLHAVKSDIASLALWRASLTAIATMKKSQIAFALALLTVFAGLIGSVATILWLHSS